MPETRVDEAYDARTGRLVSSRTYEVSDARLEQEHAGGNLRAALAVLATWEADAKSLADLTAMNAAQRLARQAVIETRVAALAQGLRRLVLATIEE